MGVLVKANSSTSPALGLWGERQLGDGQLVLHPPACAIRIAWGPRCARLLLVDLGGEQIADDPLRLVLALHGGGDDLVAQGIQGAAFMPNSLSPAMAGLWGVEDLGTLHQTAPLRLSPCGMGGGRSRPWVRSRA